MLHLFDKSKSLSDPAYYKAIDNHKDVYSKFSKELADIYNIVIDFIRRKQRILVGGMAIDYSLKLVGDKLYDTDKIDYDFISPEYFKDAYDLGALIAEKYDDISIIGARHISTMRVRYRFIPVADITYVPEVLFGSIKTLQYEGVNIIHPHFQMIDQLRGLRNTAENPPVESYLSDRAEKDIKRFHMLSKYYNFETSPFDVELKTSEIPVSLLEDNCLAGYISAIYWANKMKVSIPGKLTVTDSKIVVEMPRNYLVNFFTDSIDLVKKVGKDFELYNRLLDKLPSKWLVSVGDLRCEVYDSKGEVYLADKLTKNIHIMGLYGTLEWLLIQYLFENDLHARNVFVPLWRSMCDDFNGKLKYLPVPAEFYGKYNWSDSYLLALQKHIANMKGKQITGLLPRNAYPKKGERVKSEYYLFNIEQSELLRLGGDKCSSCE